MPSLIDPVFEARPALISGTARREARAGGDGLPEYRAWPLAVKPGPDLRGKSPGGVDRDEFRRASGLSVNSGLSGK
jgi:hypothetical protein